MTRASVLSWDWREQPDLDRLARIVHDVSAGTVHLHQINTGGGDYAIVVADRELTETEAAGVFEAG